MHGYLRVGLHLTRSRGRTQEIRIYTKEGRSMRHFAFHSRMYRFATSRNIILRYARLLKRENIGSVFEAHTAFLRTSKGWTRTS